MASQTTFDFDAGWCHRLYLGSNGSNNYAHMTTAGWDANGDGAFTLGDVGLWADFVFRLPAKLAMLAIDDTSFGRFFEIDCSTGSGFLAGGFSFVVWAIVLLVVLSMLGALAEDYRDLRAPKSKRP